ncbi:MULTISPECIES: zinc ribbon domain-containing protein, partial [unclassified Microcoleus]
SRPSKKDGRDAHPTITIKIVSYLIRNPKSGLNKSLLDAAHGQFASVLKYVAWKLGKSVLFVDPKGTSQNCWNCLNKVPK